MSLFTSSPAPRQSLRGLFFKPISLQDSGFHKSKAHSEAQFNPPPRRLCRGGLIRAPGSGVSGKLCYILYTIYYILCIPRRVQHASVRNPTRVLTTGRQRGCCCIESLFASSLDDGPGSRPGQARLRRDRTPEEGLSPHPVHIGVHQQSCCHPLRCACVSGHSGAMRVRG
jgi:hypothetical protein